MCDILYANDKQHPVNNLIRTLYYNQKYRGTQGYGFLGFDGKEKPLLMKSTIEKPILERLSKTSFSQILFHHRIPTSTANIENACHPFEVRIGDKIYALIHNGHIQNAYDILDKHEKMNIVYSSVQDFGKTYQVNDSEVLAVDMALFLSGQIEKPESRGSIACICIERNAESPNPVAVYFYHNTGSPLKQMLDEHSLILSSEGGDAFDEVEINTVWKYDPETHTITEHATQIFTAYIHINRTPAAAITEKKWCAIHYSHDYCSYNAENNAHWQEQYQQEINLPDRYDTSIREIAEKLVEEEDEIEESIKEARLANDQDTLARLEMELKLLQEAQDVLQLEEVFPTETK